QNIGLRTERFNQTKLSFIYYILFRKSFNYIHTRRNFIDMAIYRFRVTFEDYDDIIREIEIISSKTFLDLHQAIHEALGYNPDCSSSFYVSNDQWKKGEEIAYLPSELKKGKGVNLMEDARLNKFIDDPHQKFY